MDCGIRESALSFGVFTLLGLDPDSIGLSERFLDGFKYYAQIRLELFSNDALLRFVLVHAKGRRNSRIVDERDVGRDGRNERNAPQRQEQFGPDFHRPPRKGRTSPLDIRATGILHRITTLAGPERSYRCGSIPMACYACAYLTPSTPTS